MDATPGSTPAKGARAKAKTAAKSKEATAGKPRAAKMEEVPTVQITAIDPVESDLTAEIATAAYFLAAARNFAPGHELDDWLEAERAVRQRMPS